MPNRDPLRPLPPDDEPSPDEVFERVERRLRELAALERQLAGQPGRLMRCLPGYPVTDAAAAIEPGPDGGPGTPPSSWYDGPTGLLNAVGFVERLDPAIQAHAEATGTGAIVLLRVELRQDPGEGRFEAAARQVADRLRLAVRGADLVARLDPSTFAVWLGHLGAAGDAVAVAGKLADRVEAPLRIRGHEHVASCAAGVAVYPADGAHGSALLELAQASLRFAQANGLRLYQFFSPDAPAIADPGRLRAQARLQRDLQAVLDTPGHGRDFDAFRLRCVPQVDLHRRQVESLDLSLAWFEPGQGWRDGTDLAVDVEAAGLWPAVLEVLLARAGAEAGAWPSQLGLGLQLPAGALADAECSAVLAAGLARAGLDAARFRVDVAEPALGTTVRETDAAAAAMAGLRALGLRTGVDRFGRGACSLGVLRACATQEIRLDAMPVQRMAGDPSCEALVRAVATYGRASGARVVAAGVSDLAMLRRVRRAGCDAALGPLFGPARRPDAVAPLLRPAARGWPGQVRRRSGSA